MRHIISILLENEAGALSRVSGLFAARGYNIESLTVAPTNDAAVSRITVVTAGSDNVIEQIEKQLNKLVDVVRVIDLTADEHIEREMMLLKLRTSAISPSLLDRLVQDYEGKVMDRAEDLVVVEISGVSEKLDRAIGSVPDEAIHELVRSGVLGIATGSGGVV
ncbi:MAG: acetolactate synthase small subunit [Gammaproteobacteria bacterium]|nr:acetolactate synthase small subunit [Gammaproteobacteria bacterium]